MMAETLGMMRTAGTVGPPNIRRFPRVRPRRACLMLPEMIQQPPAPGLVLGGVPGGTDHLVHPKALLAPCAPAPQRRLSPMALVTALSSVTQLPAHLRWIRPPPPSPAPAAVGSPGRPVPAAFPEQMAAAWGERRRLSASFLSCTHSVIPGGSGSGGRCRWGQRWPYISHGFSELSPRGQATQED